MVVWYRFPLKRDSHCCIRSCNEFTKFGNKCSASDLVNKFSNIKYRVIRNYLRGRSHCPRLLPHCLAAVPSPSYRPAWCRHHASTVCFERQVGALVQPSFGMLKVDLECQVRSLGRLQPWWTGGLLDHLVCFVASSVIQFSALFASKWVYPRYRGLFGRRPRQPTAFSRTPQRTRGHHCWGPPAGPCTQAHHQRGPHCQFLGAVPTHP